MEQSVVATTRDAFALTLFKDSISLSPGEKAEMVAHILQSAERAAGVMPKPDGTSWTGDTQGHEFLFRNPLFDDLQRKIGSIIRDYVEELDVDSSRIDFYYQRSWATVTQRDEHIYAHKHLQSHISFAYYLLKPESSGDLQFTMQEVPNEFSPMVFGTSKPESGLIRNLTLRNTKVLNVEAKEGDILVFPSKILHATQPNMSDNPRISISGDVTVMLKDSTGHEFMMPNFRNWQQF